MYTIQADATGFFKVLYKEEFIIGPFQSYKMAKSFILTMYAIMEEI